MNVCKLLQNCTYPVFLPDPLPSKWQGGGGGGGGGGRVCPNSILNVFMLSICCISEALLHAGALYSKAMYLFLSGCK